VCAFASKAAAAALAATGLMLGSMMTSTLLLMRSKARRGRFRLIKRKREK
jgi:hypothetical protein